MAKLSVYNKNSVIKSIQAKKQKRKNISLVLS